MPQARTERPHEAIVGRLAQATESLVPFVPGGGPPETEGDLDALLVPRSEGAPCGRCGGTISRVPVRGRSTYFCPDCQTK